MPLQRSPMRGGRTNPERPLAVRTLKRHKCRAPKIAEFRHSHPTIFRLARTTTEVDA